jgi:hypothetical protein
MGTSDICYYSTKFFVSTGAFLTATFSRNYDSDEAFITEPDAAS